MISAYTAKLGLKIRCINIGSQKIDRFTLEMFGIVLASFQIKNKFKKAQFFQETLFGANISKAKILNMLF